MAGSLIETLAGDFDPTQFSDSYREALQAVIDAKVSGHQIVRSQGSQPTSGTVVDLMAALRASVEAAKKGASPRQPGLPRPVAPTKTARATKQAPAGKAAAVRKADSAEKAGSAKQSAAAVKATPAKKAQSTSGAAAAKAVPKTASTEAAKKAPVRRSA